MDEAAEARIVDLPFFVGVATLTEPLLLPDESELAGGMIWVVVTPANEVGSPPPACVRLLTLVKFCALLPGGFTSRETYKVGPLPLLKIDTTRVSVLSSTGVVVVAPSGAWNKP